MLLLWANRGMHWSLLFDKTIGIFVCILNASYTCNIIDVLFLVVITWFQMFLFCIFGFLCCIQCSCEKTHCTKTGETLCARAKLFVPGLLEPVPV